MLVLLLLFFFAFPLLSTVVAARKIRQWQYQVVIFAFFMLGAYIIVPYDEGDIALYQVRMDHLRGVTGTQFFNEFVGGVALSGISGLEIFFNLNVFLVSRFTTDVAVCYCVTAAVYFIAWRAIILTLLKIYDEHNKEERNFKALLFLVFFGIYVIFFRVINGRFYLAYWVFAYAYYKIVAERKLKYHWLLFSTIFIHQAFLFLNILGVLFNLLKPVFRIKRAEYVLFVLIIGGTIFSETGIAVVNDYLSRIGGDFEDHFSAYTTDHYIEGQMERTRQWFVELRTPLLFYSLVATLLFSRFKRAFDFDEKAHNMYFFILMLWAINAFTINVPSFGDRFRNILMGLILMLLFYLFATNPRRPTTVLFYLTAAAFIFYKLVTIKMLEGYINTWLLYPFTVLLNHFSGPVPIGGS